jgi:hypothetical protein
MRIAAIRLLALVGGALVVGAPLGAQQHRQKNVLTTEEIYHWKANMSTAYDAVSMMRPHWLRVRELSKLPGRRDEPFQGTQVNIYLNNQNMGSADFLKTIPLENVLEMRWLSANETASQFGPTDGQAAIVVTLKR